jgi:hypothetical protein
MFFSLSLVFVFIMFVLSSKMNFYFGELDGEEQSFFITYLF